MKQRIIKIVKPAAILLAIGFTYIILHNLTGFAVPCPYYSVLHIYCPGCGVSRMFLHLLRFEFYEAFSANCAVFCLLPVFAAAAIWHAYKYIRYGSAPLNRAEKIICWITAGILIAFAVLRNIYPVDILVP
ncbi:MAG TPA: DUF2752 domain-containing protein [Ruminococcaceae bacterium]|nr:DUF2752 domain-containing protein [Oscillospiraceae bacterium]